MSVYDVRNADTSEVDKIKWVGSNSWDLVKAITSPNRSGVKFSGVKITSDGVSCALVSSKGEAKNLIKALEKAIELGWLS